MTWCKQTLFHVCCSLQDVHLALPGDQQLLPHLRSAHPQEAALAEHTVRVVCLAKHTVRVVCLAEHTVRVVCLAEHTVRAVLGQRKKRPWYNTLCELP